MCWWKTLFVEISLKIKKTGLSVKLLRGTCVTCNRTKSLTVSDQTIAAEGLGDFFKRVIKFVHQGKGLDLGIIHQIYSINVFNS